ncbi:MAG: hypothetical protein WBE14_24445, partial [Xanthobacteraceae bacterium]
TISVGRWQFISALGGASLAWPLAAYAQQGVISMVGYLHSGSPGPFAGEVEAFRQGLKETGFVEGQNVSFEYRWAEGQSDQLPALAVDLVRRQVTVIATMRRHRAGGKSDHRDHTNRVPKRQRSDQSGPRNQHQSATRQHHRCEPVRRHGGRQTNRTSESNGSPG